MLRAKLEIVTDSKVFPVGELRIEKISHSNDGTADYTCEYGVDNNGEMKFHTRILYGFPRETLNAMALVLKALTELDEKHFYLHTPLNIKKGKPRFRRRIGG